MMEAKDFGRLLSRAIVLNMLAFVVLAGMTVLAADRMGKAALRTAVRESVRLNNEDRQKSKIEIIERIDKLERRLGLKPASDLYGGQLEARR